jgi:hypothetical protein
MEKADLTIQNMSLDGYLWRMGTGKLLTWLSHVLAICPLVRSEAIALEGIGSLVDALSAILAGVAVALAVSSCTSAVENDCSRRLVCSSCV